MSSTPVHAFLARRHGHWIDGAAVPEGSQGEIVVVDPATEAAIARIAAGGQAEVDQAVASARRALQGPWGDMAPDERTRILLAFAALMDANAETITELAVLDNGMPRAIAESCAPFCSLFLRYYAGWTSKITGQTLPSAAQGKRPSQLHAYTLREPVGVVGAITPWNYPFGMEMLKIAPVLATGCTLVLKPAEDAPLAALFMAELASQAGVPPGVFNVVNGVGETAGAAVAAHPGIDKVAFTGSTEVGRHIVHAAAGNLKKVSLELGGKSPVLVFPDANLEAAIPGVAMAAFMLQGQNCVCGSRVYAHVSIAEQLARGVAEFAASMGIGPGSDPKNMIGPLISARQRDRVEGFFASAAQEGARCLGGGTRVGERGFFVAPTVYTDCTPDMRIVREEIFGPVLALQTFDRETPEELAAMANDTDYGLTASVWTRDLRTAHTMSRLIDAGQVGVNCHAAMDPTMPFGGFKQSGWGREFGADALELYLRTKAVTVAWD
jgi:phenylacetaldehyde dehydrogenase